MNSIHKKSDFTINANTLVSFCCQRKFPKMLRRWTTLTLQTVLLHNYCRQNKDIQTEKALKKPV